MARPRKLTDEEIAAAAVMWLADVRRKLIAKRFGVDRETLRRNLLPIINAAKSVSRQKEDSQSPTPTPHIASTANR